jgi:hypothetical protein
MSEAPKESSLRLPNPLIDRTARAPQVSPSKSSREGAWAYRPHARSAGPGYPLDATGRRVRFVAVSRTPDPWADVLADPRERARAKANRHPEVEAVVGLVVVHRASVFTGRVVGLRSNVVTLRSKSGEVRMFHLLPGAFVAGGRVATLVRPRVVSTTASRTAPRTASGSVAVVGHRARVARASRILVEGIHDALLVERIWGDDLRVEGVVVERLDGIDYLAAEIAAFGPAPGRRLGVLVDHLVPGTKESRLAEEVSHPHVLVTGTPFVDVWQAVRPAVVGLNAWPTVPKGQDWKTGICRALGEPDPATCWRRIFGSVHSYADLEPALVGAVERLIDFVSEPLSTDPR